MIVAVAGLGDRAALQRNGDGQAAYIPLCDTRLAEFPVGLIVAVSQRKPFIQL